MFYEGGIYTIVEEKISKIRFENEVGFFVEMKPSLAHIIEDSNLNRNDYFKVKVDPDAIVVVFTRLCLLNLWNAGKYQNPYLLYKCLFSFSKNRLELKNPFSSENFENLSILNMKSYKWFINKKIVENFGDVCKSAISFYKNALCYSSGVDKTERNSNFLFRYKKEDQRSVIIIVDHTPKKDNDTHISRHGYWTPIHIYPEEISINEHYKPRKLHDIFKYCLF